MENSEIHWNNWCLLCATEDSEISVDIHSDTNAQENVAGKYIEVNLKNALEKFFNICSSPNDALPKHICEDCNFMVYSVILFNERAVRVQQMYRYLEVNFKNVSCNLLDLRQNFKIFDLKEALDNQTCDKVTKICIKNEDYSMEMEQFKSDDNTCVEERSNNAEYLEDNYQENDDTCDISYETLAWKDQEESMLSNVKDEETYMSKKGPKSRRKPLVEDFSMELTCSSCGMDFDMYSRYIEHMDVEHGNATTDKFCPICDRNLKTWYHLGRHMRTHMPKESRFPIKCTICENSFSSATQLELHINRKHRNPQTFICEICGFCASSNSALNIHMYEHNGNAPFECEICKKRFNLRYKLNSHMDIHGSNKFECTICGKQLNSRNTLRNHFVVHSEEKNHKCDYCGKGFKQSKSLKAHLILHAGIKPYDCNFCELSFTSRTYCRHHMKKRHPEELASLEASGTKAYTENVPKLEALRELVKTGDGLNTIATRKTDDGNLPCFFCERVFRHRAGRTLHMKTKHPEDFADRQKSRMLIKAAKSEPVTCVFCSRIFGHRKLYLNHLKRVHPEESLDASNSTSCFEDLLDVEMQD